LSQKTQIGWEQYEHLYNALIWLAACATIVTCDSVTFQYFVAY